MSEEDIARMREKIRMEAWKSPEFGFTQLRTVYPDITRPRLKSQFLDVLSERAMDEVRSHFNAINPDAIPSMQEFMHVHNALMKPWIDKEHSVQAEERLDKQFNCAMGARTGTFTFGGAVGKS